MPDESDKIKYRTQREGAGIFLPCPTCENEEAEVDKDGCCLKDGTKLTTLVDGKLPYK